MRRWLLGLAACAALGCGLGAVASKTVDDGPVDAGQPEAGAPNLPQKADGSTDSAADGPLDAAAVRPDAGVAFAPSPIQPVYSLTAGDVNVTLAS